MSKPISDGEICHLLKLVMRRLNLSPFFLGLEIKCDASRELENLRVVLADENH